MLPRTGVIGKRISGRTVFGQHVHGNIGSPVVGSGIYQLNGLEAAAWGEEEFPLRANNDQTFGWHMEPGVSHTFQAGPSGYTTGTGETFTPAGIMVFEWALNNMPKPGPYQVSIALSTQDLVATPISLAVDTMDSSPWDTFRLLVNSYVETGLASAPSRIGVYLNNNTGNIGVFKDGTDLGTKATFTPGTPLMITMACSQSGLVDESMDGTLVRTTLITDAASITSGRYASGATDIFGTVIP